MSLNPKDTEWKSVKYRRFIRDNMVCKFCRVDFIDEPPTYESHHHRHAGGKRPSDHMLTAMCRRCHSTLHMNEARFNVTQGMSEDKWLDHCIENMSAYLDSMNVNPKWVILQALQKSASENEK